MALDRNDLELLRDMMREVSLEVTKESETRMMAYIESHVEKKIDTLADGLRYERDCPCQYYVYR